MGHRYPPIHNERSDGQTAGPWPRRLWPFGAARGFWETTLVFQPKFLVQHCLTDFIIPHYLEPLFLPLPMLEHLFPPSGSPWGQPSCPSSPQCLPFVVFPPMDALRCPWAIG